MKTRLIPALIGATLALSSLAVTAHATTSPPDTESSVIVNEGPIDVDDAKTTVEAIEPTDETPESGETIPEGQLPDPTHTEEPTTDEELGEPLEVETDPQPNEPEDNQPSQPDQEEMATAGLPSWWKTPTIDTTIPKEGDIPRLNCSWDPCLQRWAGKDRYDTSIVISRNMWTKAKTKFVYIARGDVTADALVAGTLPDGPVLLTPPKKNSQALRNEILRLGNPTVVIIGGTAAVSDAQAKFYSDGKPFDRVSGKDREMTSIAVSKRAFPNGAPKITQPWQYMLGATYLADGYGRDPRVGSPDAVVGATMDDGPVLITNFKRGVSDAMKQEIKRVGARDLMALGAWPPARQPTQWEKKNLTGNFEGRDRYDTAINLADHKWHYPQGIGVGRQPNAAKTVYFANGKIFADAISAGTVSDGPILLTPGRTLPEGTCVYLSRIRPERIVALGGPNVVSNLALENAYACARGEKPAGVDATTGPNGSVGYFWPNIPPRDWCLYDAGYNSIWGKMVNGKCAPRGDISFKFTYPS